MSIQERVCCNNCLLIFDEKDMIDELCEDCHWNPEDHHRDKITDLITSCTVCQGSLVYDEVAYGAPKVCSLCVQQLV